MKRWKRGRWVRTAVLALTSFVCTTCGGREDDRLPPCVDVDLGNEFPVEVADLSTTGQGDDMPPAPDGDGREDLVYLWTSPAGGALYRFGLTAGPAGAGFAITQGGCDLRREGCGGGGVVGAANFCTLDRGERIFIIVDGCIESCRLVIDEEGGYY